MNELTGLLHQAGAGTLLVYTLQWLKGREWFPWITENSAAVNRWVGALFALATSIGVEIATSGSSTTGWHISIDIPNMKVLTDTIIHAATQFSGQQILYYTTLNTPKKLGS